MASPLSAPPVPAKRHALGLPAGSIRATHVLMVVGLVCLVILIPRNPPHDIPPYLVWLLFLLLGHFFAAHGHSIGVQPMGPGSPLYLPAGVVRFLTILALAGAIGWKMYAQPEVLLQQFEATANALKEQPLLPLLVLGGFFLGILVRAVVGREAPPVFLQDLEAWLSILAMGLLFIAGIIHLVIDPGQEQRLNLPYWEGFLAAVVAFYFGERS